MFQLGGQVMAQPGVFRYPDMQELNPDDVDKISDQFSMFSTDAVLNIAIQADFKELMKNKFNENEAFLARKPQDYCEVAARVPYKLPLIYIKELLAQMKNGPRTGPKEKISPDIN